MMRIGYSYRDKYALRTGWYGLCLMGITWLVVPSSAMADQTDALTDQSTSDDITDIRTDLMRIEDKLRQTTDATPSSVMSAANHDKGMGTGMMEKKKGMGMKKKQTKSMMKPGHRGQSAGMGGMGMMSMMGKPPATSNDAAAQSLPGYPNAAHLYHLGESDFFLDHADRLGLSTPQRDQLTKIKQDWQTQNRDREKQIDTLEQQLWQQTAAGQPDWPAITSTIRETERQRGALRLAFIQAVGRAVTVLSTEQVDKLMATANAPMGVEQSNVQP